MGALGGIGTREIADRRNIKDSDVLRLRGAYYRDGRLSAADIGTLLSLDSACPIQDPGWADFLTEAITEFTVYQLEPEGYVTASNADWLMRLIAPSGRLETRSRIDVLVSVMSKARWCPPGLVAFGLEQVRLAVESGKGPLRAGHPDSVGQILPAEIDLVRRMLYAFSSDAVLPLTHVEIEGLLAIDDAVSVTGRCADWSDLLIKAMANAVLAASGYGAPSREEALRSDVWLGERTDLSQTAMYRLLASVSLASVLPAYRLQVPEEAAIARLERQRLAIITGADVGLCDPERLAAWLEPAHGENALGQALIDYLRHQGVALAAAFGPVAGTRERAA